MNNKSLALADFQRSLVSSHMLVLTGAGASVPFGMPTMAEFKASIDSRWLSLIDQIPEMKKGFDLEELLGVLDFYEHIGDRYPHDALLKTWFVYQGHKNLGADAKALKNEVFDKIIELYGQLSPENQEKAKQIYLPLYNGLLRYCGNEPPVLPIFTTNYDLTFEALGIKDREFALSNGLRNIGHDSEWSHEHYRGALDYKFAVFRLHGCSHWMKNKRKGRILYQSQPDRRDLDNKEPAVLYPLLGKEVAVPNEPFATAYSYLRECLRAARVILIIGYSGRDPLVQQYIADSLRLDSQKLIVVISKGIGLRSEFQALNKFMGNEVMHISGGIEEFKLETLAGILDSIPVNRS
jgi:hypothetical protein